MISSKSGAGLEVESVPAGPISGSSRLWILRVLCVYVCVFALIIDCDDTATANVKLLNKNQTQQENSSKVMKVNVLSVSTIKCHHACTALNFILAMHTSMSNMNTQLGWM